ncbi:MAG: hypothetical protein ACRDZ4_01965, partial [Egibacteraceae bacterium]
PTGSRKFDPAAEKWKIANTPSGFGPDFDRMRREQALQFIGAGGQGGGGASIGTDPASILSRASFGELSKRPRNIQDPNVRNLLNAGTFVSSRQSAAAGGVPQPPLPQEHGIQELGLLNPRRQFYDEGGGVAPGMDTGEDKIPAMLRSEELVLTPELASAVEKADPFKPNPELIVALQGLAQQPLEYDEMSGEHMAVEGGVAPRPTNLPAIAEFLKTLFGAPTVEPDPRTPFDFGEEFAVPTPPTAPTPQRPTEPSREDLLRQGAGATLLEGLGVPSPAQAGASPEFSAEGLGSVSITGPDRLTQPGNAGFGQITPQPGRQGSFSAMTSTVPSAQPLTPEQQVQRRFEMAVQHRDGLAAVLSTDIVGSPAKQARFLSALEAADRQVKTVTDEILAREDQRLRSEETDVRRTMAQANLNESVASTLRSKAQQQTAEAALAKQMLEAATTDPVAAQILNGIEKLGGIPDERTAQLYESVLNKVFEGRGIQINERGWLRRLFGAPRFDVQPAQTEAGGQEGVPDDVTGLLQASKAPITPEMLAYFSQFAGQ